MAIKTIYIARHGYRSNWLPDGPYPPPPTNVDSDVPLAAHGIDQAKQLADFVAKLDVKPQLIFSSPFYRCLQTSKPVKEKLDIPLYVDNGVGEWYRPDRPIIPIPAPVSKLNGLFDSMISEDWESSIIPSDKGETKEDIFERCNKFLGIFIPRVEEVFPEVSSILIVTHAATKAALGMNLLGFPDAIVSIDDKGTVIRNGSCSIDQFDLIKSNGKDVCAKEWELKMNGNTSFLTKGEEMNWDFRNGFEAGSDADIRARKLADARIQRSN
ncbi:similar to Saccharomyces cerevisiae YOR110W TFC7 One of six subunits of the RNA polymerase III transcription initiation factor complex (TFIIIC) [Maudiozyma barnettii]|uniref:Similar to Saccharomyces cerevisiae YOR110W TFC7 One of six subunits of the RNA polymerase III transcription initiation factor complex (TFIIIC) n=1 Tax=Maudiozyma barnettii TaxID=61262 RepID=A0A8H2VC31_9SACH|nr:uncharacterized protein KABA2_01S15136 [Kazachstania barnettii]CAB4252503.1 similar to Saccharomyces cerevisiae YOR110W TFC7 One of six subunits of the RNA polymerase III transcription initiation factor complex (TFIIIC) [Kazachstania barnettii]CAD1779237.1 similar to Saccharomyces cerevisiae YOR110W TFC7 One of six subunits of the RNA polymerase III transcription initiation factor complex (TFIIIC) [Kazachstania barnettii]